jgi:hypothetical protein
VAPAAALLTAGVLATGTVTAFAATAPAVPAKKSPPIITFTSGTASIRAGGHTWAIDVSVIPGFPSPYDVGIGITTSHRGGSELHDWAGLGIPASDFKVSTAKGSAKLDSHSALSPLASLTLTFAPTSHKRAASSKGSQITYSGTLKGADRLVTGLKGLKLSGKHVTFRHASMLTVDRSCVPPHPACSFTTWGGPLPTKPGSTAPLAGGSTIGAPGHQETFVTAGRTIKLKGTAQRQDVGILTLKKPPKFSKSAGTLRVTSSASRIVTGSATFSQATAQGPAMTSRCSLSGKTYTQRLTAYAAHFSAKAYKAHMLLSGTLTVKSSGIGRFQIVSLKRK